MFSNKNVFLFFICFVFFDFVVNFGFYTTCLHLILHAALWDKYQVGRFFSRLNIQNHFKLLALYFQNTVCQ